MLLQVLSQRGVRIDLKVGFAETEDLMYWVDKRMVKDRKKKTKKTSTQPD